MNFKDMKTRIKYVEGQVKRLENELFNEPDNYSIELCLGSFKRHLEDLKEISKGLKK